MEGKTVKHPKQLPLGLPDDRPDDMPLRLIQSQRCSRLFLPALATVRLIGSMIYIYILLLIIINYCYYYYIYIYTSSDDFELKQSMSTIHIHVDTNWIKLWIELPKQHTQNQPKLRALWCLHSNGYRHPNLSWTMSPCRFSLSLFVAKLNLNTYYTGILCMCNICWRLCIYIYTIIDIYVIHIINIMYIYNIESYNKI